MAAISIGGQQAISRQFGTDASLSLITVTPSQSNSALSPYGNVQELNAGAGKLSTWENSKNMNYFTLTHSFR